MSTKTPHHTLKICLISQEYPPETGNGGIGTYTYHLAHGLTEKGHTVIVLSKATKNETISFDKKVKVYRIFDKKVPLRGLTRIANLLSDRYFGYWWHSHSIFEKLKELNEQEHFDIIEAPLWAGESVAFNNSLKVPLVIRLQTPFFKYIQILGQSNNKAMEKIEQKVLNKATLIGSISHAIADLIIDCYNINSKKILFTPLGIPFPELKKPLFKKNSYKLLYVSRLETRKGTQEFIEALPEILKDKRITIDIIGKDIAEAPNNQSYLKYFQKIVPKELQKRVIFHGFISDEELKNFYKNCDLFVMPSRYESFGLVYLEAMAYGKPVIGTKIGGIPEVVRDNETGFLVEVNNPKQIASAVQKIFADEKVREKLSMNAFNFVRKNFSIEQMVNSSLNLYNEAITKYKNETRQQNKS